MLPTAVMRLKHCVYGFLTACGLLLGMAGAQSQPIEDVRDSLNVLAELLRTSPGETDTGTMLFDLQFDAHCNQMILFKKPDHQDENTMPPPTDRQTFLLTDLSPLRTSVIRDRSGDALGIQLNTTGGYPRFFQELIGQGRKRHFHYINSSTCGYWDKSTKEGTVKRIHQLWLFAIEAAHARRVNYQTVMTNILDYPLDSVGSYNFANSQGNYVHKKTEARGGSIRIEKGKTIVIVNEKGKEKSTPITKVETEPGSGLILLFTGSGDGTKKWTISAEAKTISRAGVKDKLVYITKAE